MNGAVSKINSDIETINEWIQSAGMQLNPERTQEIMIGSRYNHRKTDMINYAIDRVRVSDFEVDYLPTWDIILMKFLHQSIT